MSDLFGFGNMGTYEQRKVDNFKEGNLIVDTAKVTDGNQPYETGIKHPDYNSGEWVIVEAYDTKKEAKQGHEKWVTIMTSSTLPTVLEDCQNSHISSLGAEVGMKLKFPKKDYLFNETK